MIIFPTLESVTSIKTTKRVSASMIRNFTIEKKNFINIFFNFFQFFSFNFDFFAKEKFF